MITRLFAVALASLLCLCAGLTTASANDSSNYREQITQLNQKLVELRAFDTEAAMPQELNQAQKWLEDALVQLGEEEFGMVKGLVRRADVQIDYIAANIALVRDQTTAASQEKALEDMRARGVELKTKLEELKASELGLQTQINDKGAK